MVSIHLQPPPPSAQRVWFWCLQKRLRWPCRLFRSRCSPACPSGWTGWSPSQTLWCSSFWLCHWAWLEMMQIYSPAFKKQRQLLVKMLLMTHPLYTCWCPLARPSTVVSFRIVCIPLSTLTWAMPAPIRPAPKMARVLFKGTKATNWECGNYYALPCVNNIRYQLTSLLSLAFQSGSSCRQPGHGTGQSKQRIQMFSPNTQNSEKQTSSSYCVHYAFMC